MKTFLATLAAILCSVAVLILAQVLYVRYVDYTQAQEHEQWSQQESDKLDQAIKKNVVENWNYKACAELLGTRDKDGLGYPMEGDNLQWFQDHTHELTPVTGVTYFGGGMSDRDMAACRDRARE
jgi:hypothetical protein